MTKKLNYKTLALQIAVCAALLLLAPVICYIFTGDFDNACVIFGFLAPVLVPCIILFFLNYYLLLPKLFFRKRRTWFFVANAAAIPLIKFNFIFELFTQKPPEDIPMVAWIGMAAVVFANLLFYSGSIAIAWGILNATRSNILKEQLAEEKQRHTEAELVWLKNQINPHFLFNTLNNISSLVAIDIDRTQDSIARLSDLLRYAMYESDKPSVPLGKEVEFMQNYISLMNLRCNDRTEVDTVFDIASPSAPIAPLLLVSLIENAYKHGISSNRPSFIHIALTESDGNLVFICENSNYPKNKADNSGNGIGLPNMKRRLALLYAGRYSWEQSIANDIYHIKICIKL